VRAACALISTLRARAESLQWRRCDLGDEPDPLLSLSIDELNSRITALYTEKEHL
jgi:uncharacterized small protein (DUF1192 family)